MLESGSFVLWLEGEACSASSVASNACAEIQIDGDCYGSDCPASAPWAPVAAGSQLGAGSELLRSEVAVAAPVAVASFVLGVACTALVGAWTRSCKFGDGSLLRPAAGDSLPRPEVTPSSVAMSGV